MSVAYVDTSCLVAIAFDESAAARTTTRLRGFDRLVSSNLLEAELRSALKREGAEGDPVRLLSWLTWIHPNRSLAGEFERIAALGYLKGADLWHVANALFIDPEAHDLTFITLDRRQEEVAARLGFST
jgi:predicted nucleic acid-binding protein